MSSFNIAPHLYGVIYVEQAYGTRPNIQGAFTLHLLIAVLTQLSVGQLLSLSSQGSQKVSGSVPELRPWSNIARGAHV